MSATSVELSRMEKKNSNVLALSPSLFISAFSLLFSSASFLVLTSWNQAISPCLYILSSPPVTLLFSLCPCYMMWVYGIINQLWMLITKYSCDHKNAGLCVFFLSPVNNFSCNDVVSVLLMTWHLSNYMQGSNSIFILMQYLMAHTLLSLPGRNGPGPEINNNHPIPSGTLWPL